MKAKLLSIVSALFLAAGSQAQFTNLFNFTGIDGANPFENCSLTLSGNKLYGMTYEGGINDSGVIFSIDTNGNFYKVILNFNGTNGSYPCGSLILSGQKLYGMAQIGGLNYYGDIFSIDTNGNNYKDIHDFNLTNGKWPLGNLTLSGGVLYGTAAEGGANGDGCIFSIDTNGNSFNDIFNFNGSNGILPDGSLILSGAELFGMTETGGSNNMGVIFSIDTNGNFYKDILNFNGTNGSGPDGSLILSGAELFGMTLRGGVYGDGVLFSIDSNGNFYKDLLDFNGINGALPIGDVTLSGNILYGMTQRGGVTHDSGCIFSIDSNGNSYSDLLDFNGANGYFPSANLALSSNVMYGMTFAGGTYGYGVIFSFKDTNITTSVNESQASSKIINVYPNPNNGKFTIEYRINNKSFVDVYNMLGEKVYRSQLNSNLTQINLSNQPAGIYLYRVISEQGQLIESGKIIIQ